MSPKLRFTLTASAVALMVQCQRHRSYETSFNRAVRAAIERELETYPNLEPGLREAIKNDLFQQFRYQGGTQ